VKDNVPRWREQARRTRGWLLQAAIGALLVGLAIWQVDLGRVGSSLSGAHYQWALLAVTIYALTRVIHTVHWQVYLTKVGRVPFPGLFGAFVIGNFVNNILPARVGDVATIQIVANRYGLSRAGLIAASGAETVLDGGVLVVLMLMAIALLDVTFAPPIVLWMLSLMVLALFVALAIISRFVPEEMPRFRWLDGLPERPVRVLRDAWPRIRDGLEALRNERLLAVVLALTFVGYLVEVLTFWAFGRAFGLGLPLSAYVSVTVAVSFVRTFPITFQNIGTYEVVLIGLLRSQGVATADAFSYAVATRILVSLAITVMGLVAMWLMGMRPREVFGLRASSRPADEQVDATVGRNA
jgi:uncharacterized protein (TIRG00374 family)